MTREKLTLFDTTLRDGAQMAGVDFSLADKRHIAALLDGLGVDYIEGGYPGAAISEHFCDDCNRLRLTAAGELHACLGHDDAIDLRGVVRAGARKTISCARSRRGHGQAAGHMFADAPPRST